ncbi:MAG TPA: hypothetical protein VMF53_03445 [Alphaproteobacteria bacterium]|nr:hypothetical protein [Alphaproteobacteria bacterium]
MRLVGPFAFLLLAALAPALVALPADAQAPQGTPTRVRGTVETLEGQTLTVKSRDGTLVHVTLAPNYAVRAVVRKSLADIKVDDYVASTSVRGTDGRLHAVEVHIFPAAMRGTAEGQFPWDLVPDSLMTNATVTGIVKQAGATALTVSYKGKSSVIMVGPDVPVVGYAPGDASLLKPGAAVFVFAFKHPDGSLTSASVTAEKDGVKPPM